ncbi:MAG: AAA family ATPase [Myxococcales bacterium]|nr:AAA family ATPase [Myxococcales bacterium]
MSSTRADSFDALLRQVARSPAVPAPFSGTSRYALEERLGEGAFGIVYRALDRQRGERVALKLLRDGGAASLYRFKREFRALSDLSHPNVVRLYELAAEGTSWFFTMELVAGQPFDRWVGRSEQRLRRALLGLVRGLLALHGAGKLHRDLKPSNVLVTAEGRTVILDFGLVGELAAERSVMLAGTPLYMAPEEGDGRSLDPASDWYAVGVMLFEALAGARPFEGEAVAVLTDKRAREAPDVRALAPDAPADLAALAQALLLREPRARPDGAAVLALLERGASTPSAPPEGEPFVGREAELARFASELEASSAGGARIVLVHGPSGVGKSALMRRFAERARGRGGALVLSGRCHANEALRYKALDAVIDELVRVLAARPLAEVAALLPRDAAALARLFPVMRRLEPVRRMPERALEAAGADARRLGVAALRELFLRLGDHAPVVLVIDDLQWGDADSAALLAELLRPPDAPRLLLCGAYRSEEAESPLCAALRALCSTALAAVPFTEVALPELGRDEALALAAQLLGAEGRDPARALAVVAGARGHPLFLQELAREGAAPGSCARGLEELLGRRVAALDPAAREVLEVCAVAGAPLDAALVREAAGLGEGMLAATATLRGEHLVRVRTRDDHEALEAYHDRVREIVVAGLPPERLLALHTRLAAVLERDPACPPERVGRHLREAGELARAAGHFEEAARRAAEALAFDHAAALYRETLALRGRAGLPGKERELRRRLGDACVGAGRATEAADAYLLAAQASAGLLAVDLRRRAAEALLLGGHLDRGRAVLGDVFAALGMRMPSTTWRAAGTLVADRVWLALRRSRYQERAASALPVEELLRLDALWTAGQGLLLYTPLVAGALLAEHAVHALRAGEISRVLQATCSEALVACMRGLPAAETTTRALVRARALAARMGTKDAALLVGVVETMTALMQGRPAHALAHAEAILRERPEGGSGLDVGRVECLKHNALLLMGRAGDSARELPVLIQAMQARGNLLGWTWLSLYASWASTVCDAGTTAQAELARVEDAFAPWKLRGVELQAWWRLYARIHILLHFGDGRAAYAELDPVWHSFERRFVLEAQLHRIEARWLRARTAIACSLADRGRAPALHAEALDAATRIERERTAWGDALATELRAGVALARGAEGAAVKLLAAAAPALLAAGFEVAAVAAAYERGRLVGGDEGRALRARAERWLAAQEVASPVRYCGLYLPVRER